MLEMYYEWSLNEIRLKTSILSIDKDHYDMYAVRINLTFPSLSC